MFFTYVHKKVVSFASPLKALYLFFSIPLYKLINSQTISDFELRIKTNKREDFKESLRTLHIGGGGDCPEMAMSGIELGLQSGGPYSYMFVFTDARAKDINKYERVKNLALELNTKVIFFFQLIRYWKITIINVLNEIQPLNTEPTVNRIKLIIGKHNFYFYLVNAKFPTHTCIVY